MPRGYPSNRCDCQVCKTDSRRLYYNKYGREHHGACMCDKCVRSWSQHNSNKTCECDDCGTHRHYLYNKDAKRGIRRAVTNAVMNSGRITKVATINLCGRKGCNAMMTSDAAGVMQLSKTPDDDSRAFELCPACVGDMVRALESTDIGPREQAYKEPYTEPKSEAEADPLSGLTDAEIARAYMRRVGQDAALKELDQ